MQIQDAREYEIKYGIMVKYVDSGLKLFNFVSQVLQSLDYDPGEFNSSVYSQFSHPQNEEN